MLIFKRDDNAGCVFYNYPGEPNPPTGRNLPACQYPRLRHAGKAETIGYNQKNANQGTENIYATLFETGSVLFQYNWTKPEGEI